MLVKTAFMLKPIEARRKETFEKSCKRRGQTNKQTDKPASPRRFFSESEINNNNKSKYTALHHSVLPCREEDEMLDELGLREAFPPVVLNR